MCSAGADSTRLKAGKRPNASTIECVRPLRRVDAFEGWQPGVLSRSFSKTLCRAAAERWGVWRLALLQPQQTAGLNALNNRGQWPECLVPAAAEGFRGLRPGKRQAWTPFTTEGSGLSAWSKLPRVVFEAWQTAGLNALNYRGQWPERLVEAAAEGFRGFEAWQTAGLNALNYRGQWPECLVEAAAEGFRGFRGFTAGKRQAWTPLTTEGSGLSAWSKLLRRVLRGLRPGKRQAWTPLTTEGSGLSAWSKLLRRVLGVLEVLRLANGRLERP